MRGADRLLQKLGRLPHACKTAADQAAAASARYTLQKARVLVPVRTGHLKSTLHSRRQGNTYIVGTACHYAFYVEGGTRRMRAQPYLRPAFDAGEYLARLHRALREAIR